MATEAMTNQVWLYSMYIYKLLSSFGGTIFQGDHFATFNYF